jgi:hypothetical protein
VIGNHVWAVFAHMLVLSSRPVAVHRALETLKSLQCDCCIETAEEKVVM